jgi:hypothetical protein
MGFADGDTCVPLRVVTQHVIGFGYPTLNSTRISVKFRAVTQQRTG